MYAEQGFERIANELERNKYRKDFQEKLTYHTSDLIEGIITIENPYINGYCNELNEIITKENNQTKLKTKIFDVRQRWFTEYNTTISNYKFQATLIKDRKCRKLAKKLNGFYLNKELNRKRGKEQFEMAKKVYNQCIDMVVESGNRGMIEQETE